MQLEILSWIYGVGAMRSLALAYQQQKRKKMIFFKLCADVFWVVHYVCLGAFSGAVPNFIGIFRELVFIRRGHKKWADSPAWLILFIVLNFVLGFFTLQSAACLRIGFCDRIALAEKSDLYKAGSRPGIGGISYLRHFCRLVARRM